MADKVGPSSQCSFIALPYHTKISPLRVPWQEPPDHIRRKHRVTLLQEIPTSRNDYSTPFANDCQLRARIPTPSVCSSPLSAPALIPWECTFPLQESCFCYTLLWLILEFFLTVKSRTWHLLVVESRARELPSITWIALQSSKCFYMG